MAPLVAEQGPVNTSGTLHVRGVDVKDTTSYVTQTPPVVVSVYHALIPGVTMGDTHALLQAIAARTGTRAVRHVMCDSQEMADSITKRSDGLPVLTVSPKGVRDFMWFIEASYVFIDRARDTPDCYLMVHSSSTMAVGCLVAYLMKKYGHSLADAVEMLLFKTGVDLMKKPSVIAQLQMFEDLGCSVPSPSARLSSPRGKTRSSASGSRRYSCSSSASPTDDDDDDDYLPASQVQKHVHSKPVLLLQPVPKSAYVGSRASGVLSH